SDQRAEVASWRAALHGKPQISHCAQSLSKRLRRCGHSISEHAAFRIMQRRDRGRTAALAGKGPRHIYHPELRAGQPGTADILLAPRWMDEAFFSRYPTLVPRYQLR